MKTTFFIALTLISLIINTSCSSQKNIAAFNIVAENETELFKVDVNGYVFVNSEKVAILKDGLLTNLENDIIAILKK
jgi:hypothetical protein